jgi:hypothetical protein
MGRVAVPFGPPTHPIEWSILPRVFGCCGDGIPQAESVNSQTKPS